MNKKITILVLIVSVLISVLGIPAYAEVEQEDTPTASAYTEFVTKVEAYASTGYSIDVSYTADSVSADGVSLEPYTDTLKFETGFTIKYDLPTGIVVYDDASTPIIEGIRVNGAEISELKIPVDLDNPCNYLVEIRLVYADGLAGTVAKISAGDFDWKTVMEEPLLAMQILYYAIAALSIIIGGLGLASSKKKKVKTANDIATIVDERVREGCEAFSIQYTELLKDNLLPVFHTMVDTNKAVVKAITVSTSKSKEAPVALLDLLKEVSDVDVEHVIDDARDEVLKNIANLDAKRENIRNTLHHIAEGTYQEVQHVEEVTAIPDLDVESNAPTPEESETKSVF